MLARAVLLLVITSMSPLLANTTTTTADVPPIEPGVSLELARWRAARYSDVRYKLNLTLEKMSPVLKGTMEIRVNVGARTPSSASPGQAGELPPVILNWRKIKGHEEKSTITNVSINGTNAVPNVAVADEGVRVPYEEHNEHLIFREGVVIGENVIKLDFTSPILTSGSAITRYVDKEDGSEYIYSLFVPSDASTAFPVFDQPDLKARFSLEINGPAEWTYVSNEDISCSSLLRIERGPRTPPNVFVPESVNPDIAKILSSRDVKQAVDKCMSMASRLDWSFASFPETKPISSYVFAFAAGPWEKMSEPGAIATGSDTGSRLDVKNRVATAPRSDKTPPTSIYVRKSQAEKFKPHAAEVFRLNREAIKYFEEYFDYKFPFPKYDLVLIPEFPFGGMEHAGATFLRESAIIFPQEPTKNDHISRALLIFHEASHQWFGDTVTMRWFDDLWLKEGFATFTAYKAMERIMPEMMAWKVFYERVKQAAYRTDSTKGTTPIYQEIGNLSAAKSAYGAIVYSKAPAFLRQAEFYLGEDKFQTAVRSFLKKHEFGNAGWEDLVEELEGASNRTLSEWAQAWVTQRGAPLVHTSRKESGGINYGYSINHRPILRDSSTWTFKIHLLEAFENGHIEVNEVELLSAIRKNIEQTPEQKLRGNEGNGVDFERSHENRKTLLLFPNYGDYGYGIFLLDAKSRDYVLKNIQNEKDPFLRSMMWGALWDSVREGELEPKTYVEVAIRNLPEEEDETITASVLGHVATAVNYYLDDEDRVSVAHPLERMIEDEMRGANSLGRRITFYRGFLNLGASMRAREIYKKILRGKYWPKPLEIGRGLVGASTPAIPLKTKDKFDIVTRLLVLGDPEAPGLLAELEKTEKGDEALRYAYAARAGIATAENKAKYWSDFTENKEISESWIEAAFGPFNSIRHADLTLPYLERALKELPNHKRDRKIFFVNGWLGAFIGGQLSEEALAIVNKFLADNPGLDNDLRLKILENVDTIERAVRIRAKFGGS